MIVTRVPGATTPPPVRRRLPALATAALLGSPRDPPARKRAVSLPRTETADPPGHRHAPPTRRDRLPEGPRRIRHGTDRDRRPLGARDLQARPAVTRADREARPRTREPRAPGPVRSRLPVGRSLTDRLGFLRRPPGTRGVIVQAHEACARGWAVVGRGCCSGESPNPSRGLTASGRRASAKQVGRGIGTGTPRRGTVTLDFNTSDSLKEWPWTSEPSSTTRQTAACFGARRGRRRRCCPLLRARGDDVGQVDSVFNHAHRLHHLQLLRAGREPAEEHARKASLIEDGLSETELMDGRPAPFKPTRAAGPAGAPDGGLVPTELRQPQLDRQARSAGQGNDASAPPSTRTQDPLRPVGRGDRLQLRGRLARRAL